MRADSHESRGGVWRQRRAAQGYVTAGTSESSGPMSKKPNGRERELRPGRSKEALNVLL